MAAAHSSRSLVIKLTTNFSEKRNAKSHWEGKKEKQRREKKKQEITSMSWWRKIKHTQERKLFSISFLIAARGSGDN